MKKVVCILLSIILTLSLFSGCLERPQGEPYVPPTDLFSDPTPTPIPQATLDELPVATEGYFNPDEKTSLIQGTQYLNLFNTRTYYISPALEYVLPFSGNPSDWEVADDPYNLIKDDTIRIEKGKIVIKTEEAGVYLSNTTGKITHARTGTGYVYFHNKTTDETVKLYVNLLAQQSETNKQTNKDLPYYLYFEKGAYKIYQDGDCCLTVYTVDEDGYYTVPYLTFSVACGVTSALTPTGTYSIGGGNVGLIEESDSREVWHEWESGRFSQYVIKYGENRYLYTTLTETDKKAVNEMFAESYNEIGSHITEGYLRMQTGAAYWIFTNCPDGTTLEVRANNPRGTHIERPASIDENASYDPTDPYLINYDL